MSYKQKYVYTDNYGQISLNKVKKSSKIGEEQKSVRTTSV